MAFEGTHSKALNSTTTGCKSAGHNTVLKARIQVRDPLLNIDPDNGLVPKLLRGQLSTICLSIVNGVPAEDRGNKNGEGSWARNIGESWKRERRENTRRLIYPPERRRFYAFSETNKKGGPSSPLDHHARILQVPGPPATAEPLSSLFLRGCYLPAISRMKSGVVPQQPPTMSTPISLILRMLPAKKVSVSG